MKKFDNIFLEKIEKFVFDKKVSDVFNDMVSRSIPGYDDFLKLTGIVSKNFIKNKSICYDFGASLLNFTKVVIDFNKDKNFKILAIDNSEYMFENAKNLIKDLKKKYPNIKLDFLLSNVLDINIKKMSFGILNFILQFLPKDEKHKFLKNVYDGLDEAGAIILSEKIVFEKEEQQNFYTELYFSYKKINGYSDIEINNKKEALKDVLFLETIDFHMKRLKDIGFKKIILLMQILNFVSILAIK